MGIQTNLDSFGMGIDTALVQKEALAFSKFRLELATFLRDCFFFLSSSAVSLRLRRHSSVFHRFLKSLAVFDLLVVLGCLWMYSLPVISPRFYEVRT